MMARGRFLSFCLLLLLLEGSVLPFFFAGSWQPDLWLCAVVISVLAFDRKTALSMAVVGGLAQDIVTGNFFGIHLFPYIVIAFLTLAVMKGRYNRQWRVSLLASGAGTLGYMALLFLVVYFGGGGVDPLAYFCGRALPQLVMNLAAAVFLHPVLWNMKQEWEPKW